MLSTPLVAVRIFGIRTMLRRCGLVNRLSAALLLWSVSVAAAEGPTASVPGILPEGAALEKLWGEGHFTEGVAAAPDGTLYFSDIALDMSPGRVMKYDPRENKTTVFCADSAKSNGLMFDRQGRLLAVCGALYGKRALVEIKPDGTLAVLVDKFEGKKFNAPNDLVIDPAGRVWFSDPRYLGPESLELDHMSVFRFDPNGKLTRVTTDIEKPNGVHLSPDARTLYVAETNNGTTNYEEGKTYTPGRMTLNAFPINADGSLGKKKVLVDFGDQLGVDGMSIDTDGRIYAAVRSKDRHGIRIYTPAGKEVGNIPTPELPTNCSFGLKSEAQTLYITAGTGFYRIKLQSTGYHPSFAKGE